MPRRLSQISDGGKRVVALKLPISPLVGEMAGRPEGGASQSVVKELP